MNFTIKEAKNVWEQTIGLSFRDSIAKNEGLLFTFPFEFYYPFWNFGMRFPIDIIWFDKNKKIIQVDKNIPVMNSIFDIKFFMSKKPAKYVLEVRHTLDDVIIPVI